MKNPADYFPLVEGAVLDYRRAGPGGRASMRLEILRVSRKAGVVEASCRRTWNWEGSGGASKVKTFRAFRKPGGIYLGARLLFPLPPKIGARWERAPDSFEVASLSGRAETPAGRFGNCLKVVYRLAGGDSGDGEVFYAPGVGLVKESRREEGDPYELELAAYRIPGQ